MGLNHLRLLTLMDLPAFKKGMALMASDLNRLTNQVRASRVTQVIGGTVSVAPGGTTITVSPTAGKAGGAAAYATPFEVLLAPQEEEWTAPRFTVGEGYLLKDPNEDAQLITGFTPAFELPPVPGAILLKVEFGEDMDILAAWIEDGEISETFWSNYPDAIERDATGTGTNYLRQKYLRVCLAEVVAATDDREGPVYTINDEQVKVIQNVDTDLMLQWQVVDGMAAVVAVPWKRATRVTIPPPI